jgi:protocatechuate 3,4-dioxygenase beta subunit
MDDELHTIDRRSVLRLIGGAGLGLGAAGLIGRQTTAAAAGVDSTIPAAAAEIPDETAGPFPGDGSNGPNALAEDGIVRADITSSFGSATGVADGVPLEIVLDLQDLADGGTPVEGAAVYAWHCDAEGRYSMYSDGADGENYLRGVQPADADGTVRFTTIFPGCYQGRWPHVHFEIYDSVEAATGGGSVIKTSQLAFPQDISEEVYADARYPGSADNLSRLTLESDMVFGEDSAALQLAEISGDVDGGLTAVLAVGV